jgi:DNA primase
MDQVEQVRDRTDIVALIQSYLPLKKAGAHFKTNCPFHNERTPSFMVSPARQSWHCFGCHKGGDCFSFLMEYEKIEFPEALRMLAQKAGIILVSHMPDQKLQSEKERMYRMHELACEYYHFLLTSHTAGKQALAYCLDIRRLSPQILETFRVGYAPSTRRGLTDFLTKKKGFTADEVVLAGLATRRGSEIVDFFFNRLLFPLSDHRGNICGFAGRIMDDAADAAKYINTRETPIYHKGEIFFALNITKDAIRKAGAAIVMEGEIDVIASYQAGISNVVAIKGTAFTKEQAKLILRFAPKVILCLDSDNAGQEAMRKSVPILEEAGATVRAIVLDGKDPDEAIRHDAIAFKKKMKSDMSVYDVLLSLAAQRFDAATVEGKQEITAYILPLIARIGNEVVKEHYFRKLSALTNTSLDALYREALRAPVERTPLTPAPAVSPRRTRIEILEEYLSALILQSPSPSRYVSEIEGYQYEKTGMEKLVRFVCTLPEGSNAGDKIAPEFESTYTMLILYPLPQKIGDATILREIKKTVTELRALAKKRAIAELTTRIKEREVRGEETSDLEQQLSTLLYS